MMATVLSAYSKFSGQFAVCTMSPLKLLRPGISGHFQLLGLMSAEICVDE